MTVYHYFQASDKFGPISNLIGQLESEEFVGAYKLGERYLRVSPELNAENQQTSRRVQYSEGCE